MSLQLIAKQMEAKGRNGDSVLVHMTTGEVAGLQKLAETAGGSLSVNPETGLVEANFLKQMLPTLVGAGVGFFTANPMLGAAAGAAVGGYQANRAGRDVGAGMVMGGMGGYGGATLGSSLQAAGAPATLGTEAAKQAGTQTANNMLTNAVMSQAMAGSQAAPTPAPFLTPAQQDAAAGSYGFGGDAPRLTTTAGTGAGGSNLQVPTNIQAPGNVPAGAPTKFSELSYGDRFKRGLGGVEAMSTEEGRDKAYRAAGGSEGIIRALMFAGLPALYGARTKVPHPYGLLSADINKRGFSAAEGGEVGFFSGGGTGQGNGLLSSLVDNRPFIIDPVTGNVIRNPNLPPPAPAPAPTTFADVGGRGDGYKPNADFDTPEKQRAYYAERPNQANIVGIAQELFGMTPIGALQNRLDPEGVAASRAMVQQAPAPVEDRSAQVGTIIGGGIGMPDVQGAALGDLAGSRSREVALGRAAPNPDGSAPTITVSDGPSETGSGADYSRTDADPAGMDYSGYSAADMGLAKGGIASLARGGLKEGGFVVPADVVAFLGGGNSDNGAEKIERMFPNAMYIDGPDGGQEDTVKTSIEGKQPARVAHGEVYIPPQDVKRAGGAKVLYAMLDRVRVAATGSKKQIKPVSLERAMA